MQDSTRGQTVIDFAIAMGVFLVAVAFVFTFIPSLTTPFVEGNQDTSVTADRVASHLAEGALGDPADPFVVDEGCAEVFFDASTDVESVLGSEVIADPLRLFECPALCDGAAALVVTSEPAGPRVAGIGHHHPPSHLSGVQGVSMATLPAVGPSSEEAFTDAGVSVEDIDVLEPYAPFPHIEAILTEELGLFERGEGAAACARGETRPDGTIPVSPSGGCIGRGHPAMVTPLLNYVAAVRQLQRTASRQVPGAETVLTTSEHGHVDGMTTTIIEGTER